MGVFAIVQNFAFATGRTQPLLLWCGVTASLTALSGATLIKHYGVMGAAFGRIGIQIATVVAMLLLVRAWNWPFPIALRSRSSRLRP